jgi:hypothetical protein
VDDGHSPQSNNKAVLLEQVRALSRPFDEQAERSEMRQWHSNDGWHIDVRGSPPPQPLVAILKLVRSLRDDTPVIVHHDRDPVMLYDELAQIGWQAERLEAGEDEVRLLLRRVP